MIIFLDLFAGIGGFALGFKNAGFNFDKHYYSEVNNYAESIYARHFPDAIRLGDARRIGDDLGKIDILSGGFPCQSFSIAGKRKGFNDTRGTLFFEIERLARIYRPAYMVLENVKGLFSLGGGDTIRTILDKLRGLDYYVQLLLLNTKDFGIPQNRERCFFICSLGDRPRPEISNIRKPKAETTRSNEMTKNVCQSNRVYSIDGSSTTFTGLGGGVGAKTGLYAVPVTKDKQGLRITDNVLCIDASYQKGLDNHGQRYVIAVLTPDRENKRQQGRRFKNNNEDMFTLTAQDRHGVMTFNVPEATKKGYTEAYEGDSINLKHLNSKSRRGRIGKGIANTLECNMQQYIFKDFIIRKLTPLECERLQGFPDNWTDGLSDSQRYKCLGNAVTVKVVEEIAKSIKLCIKDKEDL